MSRRDLNEQIEETKRIIRRSVEEGARLACQEMGLNPGGQEAQEVTTTYVISYLTNQDKVKFIQDNRNQPEQITEDVKRTILSEVHQHQYGEERIEFRDDKTEIVRRLKNNVVRLTFTKRDGSTRVMYATLVPELVNLYNSHYRKYGDQGNTSLTEVDSMNDKPNDVVRVMDLEKESFRSFKPSTLQDYDEENGVPSWIESHPDNDAWYEVAKNNKPISDYVSSQGTFIQAPESSERRSTEDGFINEAQNNGILVSEDVAAALEYITKHVDRMVSGYIYTLTSLQMPEDTQEYINSRQFYRDLDGLTDDLEGVAREQIADRDYRINKRPQKMNRGGAYRIDIGTDRYYFHPYFIINRRTGKVYLDRMGWIKDISARDSLPQSVKQVDRTFEGAIERFIETSGILDLEKPTKKRIRGTDRTYEVRFNRMLSLAKNPRKKYDPVLQHYNMRVQEIASNASTQVTFRDLRLTFEVSPTGLIAVNLANNRPIKLVSVKRGTSTLRELRDGLEAYKNLNVDTANEERVNEAVRRLEEVFLQNVFNLRRKYLFPELIGRE